jgi:hydroxymethylbilane synthase
VLPHGTVMEDAASAIAALPGQPTIGTSSVRRIAQLAALVVEARFAPIRGNVDTRLRKLDADEGGFDALVLASAGLRRLGFGARISAPLRPDDCVPAPGQGTVAIEVRADDNGTRALIRAIDDAATARALDAERSVVAALGGGCQLPLGAVALHHDGELEMHAIVASLDGRRTVKRHARGRADDADALGRRLADELARGGALEILDEVRGAAPPVEGRY